MTGTASNGWLRPAYLALAVALAACSTAPSASVTASRGPLPSIGSDGARIAVNGHDLWVECLGSGEPVVVLEAGFGGSNDVWAPITRELAAETRVCAYDRLGTGFSDRASGERTIQHVVDDLHAVLPAAGISGPVVLVGHSFGGLTSAVYTAQHPDDVAALVMIDAGHPDAFERFRAVLPARERELFDSDLERPNSERIAVEASAYEARTWLENFPDVPLTVIAAARPWSADCGSSAPETCAAVDRVNLELQRDFAEMSPDARLIEADTGHVVWRDDPDLVVAEILRAVDVARG